MAKGVILYLLTSRYNNKLILIINIRINKNVEAFHFISIVNAEESSVVMHHHYDQL